MNKINLQCLAFVCLITAFALSGCYRGRPSEKAPIHLNPNMDEQPRYKTQGNSRFFADDSAMRKPVEGTVARGQLHRYDRRVKVTTYDIDVELIGDDVYRYYTGKEPSPSSEEFVYTQKIPVPLTEKLLKRAQQRYTIYCALCHGLDGQGKGIIATQGLQPPPANLLQSKERKNGYLFDVISTGIGTDKIKTMGPYAQQISVLDRWAIVAYLRALQQNQRSTSRKKDE